MMGHKICFYGEIRLIIPRISLIIIVMLYFSACQSHVAAEEMMKLCHNRKTCTVEAEEYVFGNPCPVGVNKYLNVIYTCGKKWFA